MARSKYICIAFNADLLANVTKAAASMYMTRAHYIRYVLAKELNNPKPEEHKNSSLEELFKKYVDDED